MPKKTAKNTMEHTTLRVPSDLLQSAAAAAVAAGMALPDYRRYALRQAVDRQSAVAEMAAIEERLASHLTKLQARVGRLGQVQQLQFAVLDQFMKMALTLEPEFVDEPSRAAARATGRARYKTLMESVPGAMDTALTKIFGAGLAELGTAE